jgi:hypothetical protein
LSVATASARKLVEPISNVSDVATPGTTRR